MTSFSTRQRAQTTFIAIVTAILLLAAAFRIYHIIQRPIWTDEGTTTFNLFHFNGQDNLIDGLAARDHHPPLYYVMLQAWVGLTGDSVLAMRYFAALVGILSVALMVPLAREFLKATPPLTPPHKQGWGFDWLEKAYWFVPIAAALVLTLSDPDIDLGQEIRFYTLRTLFIILSVIFYLRWIKKPSIRLGIFWSLSNLAILHTNYQGAFIMAFEGLHALLFLRGKLRLKAIGWLALCGVFFMPWFIGYGIGQFDNDQGINSTLPSTWDTFVELTYKFLGRIWPLMLGLMLLGVYSLRSTVSNSQQEPLPQPTSDTLASSVLRQPVNEGGGKSNETRRSLSVLWRWVTRDKAFFLVIWIGLTLIISFLGNEWFSILSPRRVMLISPAIALLVALGLTRFTAQTRLFLLLVILVYSASSVDDYYPKAPWDKVGADMGRYAQPGDMGLMEIYYDDTVMYYYTDHDMPPGTVVKSLRMWRQFEPNTYPNGVIDLLNQHPTVWFVHWSPDQSGFEFLKQTGHVQTALMTTYWGTNALNVYRFDVMQPQPVVDYSNGMRLRQFKIDPDKLRVDLWWSAGSKLDQDYSVSVFMLNEAGQLVAQKDDFPFLNQRPTTSFQQGEVVYDPHTLELASPKTPLPAGKYTVAVKLYTYYDGQQYPTVKGDPWEVIGTIEK